MHRPLPAKATNFDEAKQLVQYPVEYHKCLTLYGREAGGVCTNNINTLGPGDGYTLQRSESALVLGSGVHLFCAKIPPKPKLTPLTGP